jgi:hypothetical protein
MLEMLEGIGLGGNRGASASICDQVRAKQLCHDRDVETLVPGQVRLIAIATPEQFQGVSPG